MPPLPDVPQVVRVSLKFSYGSDLDVLPRFYFEYDDAAPTNAGLVTMATAIESSFVSNMEAAMTPLVTWTEVECVDLTTPDSAVGSYSFSHQGTRSGGELTANDCVLVNSTIQRRYRGGKPRMYLPWGSESDITTPQTWASGSITTFETYYTDLVNDVLAAFPSGTTGVGQVNVSYYQGFDVSINPVTGRARNISKPRTAAVVDAILSSSVNARVGSQRRRLGKR